LLGIENAPLAVQTFTAARLSRSESDESWRQIDVLQKKLPRICCCMATAMETGAAPVAGHEPSFSAIGARLI
jgi:hypothetical protein